VRVFIDFLKNSPDMGKLWRELGLSDAL
jgi:hypothetical protein